LVFTLEVPWHFSGISLVSIEITDKSKGCEMIFSQSGIDTRITKDSWKKMFETLKCDIEHEYASGLRGFISVSGLLPNLYGFIECYQLAVSIFQK